MRILGNSTLPIEATMKERLGRDKGEEDSQKDRRVREEESTMHANCPNRVREVREDLLMTREELAEKAGVSLRTVWSVESGIACRLYTKRRILQALGVPKEDHKTVFTSS